jgi:hypothetical protein
MQNGLEQTAGFREKTHENQYKSTQHYATGHRIGQIKYLLAAQFIATV